VTEPVPVPVLPPSRAVHQADALQWLADPACLDGASVITSLPDLGEMPEHDLASWQDWFVGAAALVMERVPDAGAAIFFQSDIRHDGLWIDKGALVARAAERAHLGLLFHKIVCRRQPGTVTYGRASYSHLLGFARTLRPSLRRATADVLPETGRKPGQKSMGVAACKDACLFIKHETTTTKVVDPFCGYGTVLAVANALGLDAVGVDRSSRMCRKARALLVDPAEVA